MLKAFTDKEAKSGKSPTFRLFNFSPLLFHNDVWKLRLFQVRFSEKAKATRFPSRPLNWQHAASGYSDKTNSQK